MLYFRLFIVSYVTGAGWLMAAGAPSPVKAHESGGTHCSDFLCYSPVTSIFGHSDNNEQAHCIGLGSLTGPGCHHNAYLLDKPGLHFGHAPGRIHGFDKATRGLMVIMPDEALHIGVFLPENLSSQSILCAETVCCVPLSSDTRELCAFVMTLLVLACTLLLVCLQALMLIRAIH